MFKKKEVAKNFNKYLKNNSSTSTFYNEFENYNISQGSHVALMLPRTYHFPELVLALNKLGAAFIPIVFFFFFETTTTATTISATILVHLLSIQLIIIYYYF